MDGLSFKKKTYPNSVKIFPIYSLMIELFPKSSGKNYYLYILSSIDIFIVLEKIKRTFLHKLVIFSASVSLKK